jgi:hypothetical protein
MWIMLSESQRSWAFAGKGQGFKRLRISHVNHAAVSYLLRRLVKTWEPRRSLHSGAFMSQCRNRAIASAILRITMDAG